MKPRNILISVRRLLATTFLSSAATLLAVSHGAAQIYCGNNATTCTLPSSGPSDEPLYLDSVSPVGGNGSSPGGNAPTVTINLDSNLDVYIAYPNPLLFPEYLPGSVVALSKGGAGSDNGPSAGGSGGALTVNPSDVITATVDQPINTGMGAVLIESNGGDGADNNTNNGSNGGAGGDGGSVTYGGSASQSVSVVADGVTIDGDLYGILLRTQGGYGGRGNSSESTTPEGGAGGNAGVVKGTFGAITVGTASGPATANSILGLAALSVGGRGPDAYNSSNGQTQGGGGNSLGGSGNLVQPTIDGPVSVVGHATEGSLRGVRAESIGGAGGWSYNAGVIDTFYAGGPGGDGGSVAVTVNGAIEAIASNTGASVDQSAAVYASSVGGEGGVGQHDQPGGDGGSGGSVTLTVNDTAVDPTSGYAIHAVGTAVDGIVAISSGGLGGAGLTTTQDSSGGIGGTGGPVTVTLDLDASQTIQVEASANGNDSGRGIVAQSIGNFGGPGGSDDVPFGTAGSAGAGGSGDTVTVHMNSGAISTDGTTDIAGDVPYAYGILAQSIGGGGGTGGQFTGLFGGESGAGGKGGSGDNVTVSNAGTITARGIVANGILAQSIGGGGGAGGVANAGAVALGGSGGDGGLSGTVTVTNTGTVGTNGFGAAGILAQSIQGAGGAAGVTNSLVSIGSTSGSAASTAPGLVTVTNSGSVTTTGDAAIGVHAQSIGGGGGSASGTGTTSTGVFTLGASGGSGGQGGDVLIDEVGTITTSGEYAHGLSAQSIGGGGGNGGNAFAGSVLSAAVAVGGQAGSGSNAGTVTITPSGPIDVTTSGVAAMGILGQSVGGGGGSGGNAVTDTAVDFVQIAVGGGAGSGGDGGDVDVALGAGTITTGATRGTGVAAQSIGGGGGTGGSGTSQTAGLLSIGFAVGGKGGAGGDGGEASVALSGTTIETAKMEPTASANDAVGVLVQSIGGGGGTGGGAVANAITTGIPFNPDDPDMTVTLNAQFAFGAAGGSGGTGNTAIAMLGGGSSITTNGASSHGVLVQSIGGGGGHGGDASTTTITIPDSTMQIGLTMNGTIGGSGGDGGDGGDAVVLIGEPDGTAGLSIVTTTGNYANAVVAQSVGGGGGDSGVPSSTQDTPGGKVTVKVNFALGSNPLSSEDNTGGDAMLSSVTLYAGNQIVTEGHGSRGIIAQSIGGGGGTSQGGEISAGFRVKATEESGGFSGSLGVDIGGQGGAGGTGGVARVVTYDGSTIHTSGVDADGILVQSIGGGGGLAGSLGSKTASPIIPSTSGKIDSLSANVTVGGKGGSGGTGGPAIVRHGGTIVTIEDWADGIVAQSIGGGGGTGGSAFSSSGGKAVELNIAVGGKGGTGGDATDATALFSGQNASVSTAGYMAHGIVLQAIGGGGGQGGDGSDYFGGSMSIGSGAGGSGGVGGTGGAVKAGGTVAITTTGNDAHGLIAQSIGGGGGIGGAGSSVSSRGEFLGRNGVDINVGGGGGAGGDGKIVELDLDADIQTLGDRAFGLVAQSIGGGGGIGSAGSANNLADVNVGGRGGTAADGEEVGVKLAGTGIMTSGDGAHGIIAQSIGGGGGIGGDLGIAGLTLGSMPNGGNGDGGIVGVFVDAPITTTGANAHGVIAQSVGGGGGIAGDAGGMHIGSASGGIGTAETVSVEQNAAISATGAGSFGILGISDGPDGKQSVRIAVNDVVTGGGEGGAGVVIAGGYSNIIEVASDGSVVASSGGDAIRYMTNETVGDDAVLTIENQGHISGDITTTSPDGSSAIIVINESADTLSDARLYQADVRNSGRLVIGDGGARDTTRITGDFTQGGDGFVVVGADFAKRRAGRLAIDGDADLGGGFTVAASSLVKDTSLHVLTAGGTLTGRVEPTDTPAVDYGASIADRTVSLSVDDTRFARAFDVLSGNERRVGRHLDDIFDNGSGRYAGLLATINGLSLADDGGAAYASALHALSPGASQAAAAEQSSLAQSRLDRAMTCPAFSDAGAIVSEEGCVWAEFGGGRSSQGGDPGYDVTHLGFAGGGQVEVRPNWFAGIAFGYLNSDYDGSDDLSSTDGDTGYIAAAVSHEMGGLTISGGASASYGSFDMTRRIILPGFAGTAEGNSDVYTLSARGRLAYAVGTDAAYIKPLVDLDVIYTNAGGYTESGAGIYDLAVDDQSQTVFVATPAVEVGARVDIATDWQTRVFANAGVSLSTEDDWTTSARLIEAPSGAGAFDTTIPVADVVGRVGAGLTVSGPGKFDLRAEYDGAFGDEYWSHSGMLRLSKRF
ncbi:autotransporter outer membrane beta-barrel domain-containing protein [Acuticoccus sediminis]|uniref:autotransporter outer membrane beta-barrel domain-containing protein n=1 Tax=Acuticoccus sediminis TaxID=2184697 RepID=UPI001CFD551E|nr:autotransporter outer membrane beta-barrel domain-containing protein [Acuticoccus sediminis]